MDEQDVPAGHVFISYGHEDSASVDKLRARLIDAGIRVWRDKKDLCPGDHWRTVIGRAIKDGTLVFLACFSAESLARSQSWQNEELTLAVEQMRLRAPDEPWLIPARFDNCDIPDIDIGAGRTLDSIQRCDLFGDDADDQAARLVVAIKRILGSAPDDHDFGVARHRPGSALRGPDGVRSPDHRWGRDRRCPGTDEPVGASPFIVGCQEHLRGPGLGSQRPRQQELARVGNGEDRARSQAGAFLQFGNQAKYFGAGDPRTAVPLGKWHGIIFVGALGTIILWLVELPPASVALVNREVLLPE
jgi:hypothetical protein